MAVTEKDFIEYQEQFKKNTRLDDDNIINKCAENDEDIISHLFDEREYSSKDIVIQLSRIADNLAAINDSIKTESHKTK